MKKGLLISAIASFILIGCGGGGSSSGSNITKTYKGALSKGDMVKFTFNGKSGKLDYHVTGSFAGDYKNSMTLTHDGGDFYYNGNNEMLFSNSIALASFQLKNQPVYMIGITDTKTPTIENVVGKYNFVYATNGSKKLHLCKLNINDDNTAEFGTCMDSCQTPDFASLSWSIVGDKIILSSENGLDFKAQGYVKSGSKQKDLILDIISMKDTNGGIGLAIEAKKLTSNSLGKTDYDFLAVQKRDAEIAKLKLNGSEATYYYQGHKLNTSTIRLNESICNQTFNGVAYNWLYEQHQLFDAENGLFISIPNYDNNKTLFVDEQFYIGSNKSLK